MFCYVCGQKIADETRFCYECGTRCAKSFSCEKFWRETDFFYKSAKKIVLSPKKYTTIFALIASIVISLAILVVVSTDFINVFTYAINIINVKQDGVDNFLLIREANQAWRDVWCGVVFIIFFSCVIILSAIMLVYIARVIRQFLKLVH